jgi:hypothetical protein
MSDVQQWQDVGELAAPRETGILLAQIEVDERRNRSREEHQRKAYRYFVFGDLLRTGSIAV